MAGPTETRLTADDVRAMARDLESDRVERKESMLHREARNRIRKTVCAFANDMPNHGKPGYVLVGITDDGRWSGCEITDEVLRLLTDTRDNGEMLPLPDLRVYVVDVEPDVRIAVCEVHPHPHPPVRYAGRTYIRIGSRLDIASHEQERVLSERRHKNPRAWDLFLCNGASVADLRMQQIRDDYLPRRIARDVIDARHINRWSDVDVLDTLRLWYRGIEKDGPTHASMLLFADRPRHFYSGLWLQFVRFEGDGRHTKVLDDQEYDGDVFDQLRALEKIEQHLATITCPDGREVPEYPREAVREAVINAVMHQDFASRSPILFYWYSDRIEVLNGGGLMAEVSPEIFARQGPPPDWNGRRTGYRNEAVSEAMKAYGFVNKFGTGIPKIRDTMFSNGNPYPEYSWDTMGFGVRLYSATIPRWETSEEKVAWLATKPGNEEMAPLIAAVARDERQQGRIEEGLRARRESLYAIFEARGLVVADADRERIEDCDDVERLAVWIRRAVTVDSPDEAINE